MAEWQQEDFHSLLFSYSPSLGTAPYADVGQTSLFWDLLERPLLPEQCEETRAEPGSWNRQQDHRHKRFISHRGFQGHVHSGCLLYSLNLSAAHWAEGFPSLHGMIAILNRFSSAGFDVCSSSMGYVKMSNNFPSFYSRLLIFYLFSLPLILLNFPISFFHFFPPLFLLLPFHGCHFKVRRKHVKIKSLFLKEESVHLMSHIPIKADGEVKHDRHILWFRSPGYWQENKSCVWHKRTSGTRETNLKLLERVHLAVSQKEINFTWNRTFWSH